MLRVIEVTRCDPLTAGALLHASRGSTGVAITAYLDNRGNSTKRDQVTEARNRALRKKVWLVAYYGLDVDDLPPGVRCLLDCRFEWMFVDSSDLDSLSFTRLYQLGKSDCFMIIDPATGKSVKRFYDVAKNPRLVTEIRVCLLDMPEYIDKESLTVHLPDGKEIKVEFSKTGKVKDLQKRVAEVAMLKEDEFDLVLMPSTALDREKSVSDYSLSKSVIHVISK